MIQLNVLVYLPIIQNLLAGMMLINTGAKIKH